MTGVTEGRRGGGTDGLRLRRFIAVAFLALVAASYWWGPAVMRQMSFFGVRRVEVTGTRYLTAEAVVRSLELRDEANVFDDLGDLAERLEAHGGIARAKVTRRLPGTLSVEVAEVEPVALADGPEGLIALGEDARPLPYDVVSSPVDAPIVRAADRPLVEGLARVQSADYGLYADVVSARVSGGNEMVLDMGSGRVRLKIPVDPEVVRSVSSVRRDLRARGTEWRELDGRFRGWIVVRKA